MSTEPRQGQRNTAPAYVARQITEVSSALQMVCAEFPATHPIHDTARLITEDVSNRLLRGYLRSHGLATFYPPPIVNTGQIANNLEAIAAAIVKVAVAIQDEE